MKIRLASPLQTDSIVDGEGLRTVIWTQGCSHHCEGCHNPQTHDFNAGIEMEVEEVKKQLTTLTDQDGITLSGGDPFFQLEASNQIAKYAKQLEMNVWCYTGYTFEQLMQMKQSNPKVEEFLKSIDVLIDGKFEQDKKSLNLYFRGSSNQRILDVPESLRQNKPIEIEKYKDRKENTPTYGRIKALYI